MRRLSPTWKPTWTSEQDRAIVDYRDQEGCSWPEIGRRIGRKESSIVARYRALTESGFNPHRPLEIPAGTDQRIEMMVRAGMADGEISIRVGLPHGVVSARRKMLQIFRTPARRGNKEVNPQPADLGDIVGPVLCGFAEVKDWVAQHAPRAKTLDDVNQVRLRLGLPPFAIERRHMEESRV